MSPRLAYLLMVHKNAEQIRRLLSVIHRDEHVYVIHADKAAKASFHSSIQELAGRYPNVHVMPSHRCRWGGWSMVEIELNALRFLLDVGEDWSWFLNISGQDFPLRTQESIATDLARNPGCSFVEVFVPSQHAGGWRNPYFKPDSRKQADPATRITFVYAELPFVGRVQRVPLVRRQLPDGSTWYGGSQWMVLDRQACEYIVRDPRSQRLARYLRFTYIPDESFFPTVLMNSPLRERVVPENRRTILWEPELRTFVSDDYDFLVGQDSYFARKFDLDVDSEIVAKLTRRLSS